MTPNLQCEWFNHYTIKSSAIFDIIPVSEANHFTELPDFSFKYLF